MFPSCLAIWDRDAMSRPGSNTNHLLEFRVVKGLDRLVRVVNKEWWTKQWSKRVPDLFQWATQGLFVERRHLSRGWHTLSALFLEGVDRLTSALIDLRRAFGLFELSKLSGASFRSCSSHTKNYNWPKIELRLIQRTTVNQDRLQSAQPQYVDGGW